jgi:hypothetical protein
MATTLTGTNGCATCGTAVSGGAERTRFYPRQLVSSDDLTQDQQYFRDKHRRHNRMLHGWGIVCGTCVRRSPLNPCVVSIDPGYILGPYGDEIVIPEAVPFDVCKWGVAEQVGCCPPDRDPWCAEPKGNCPEGRFYLAVRYEECPSRPVRTGGCGCGCEGDECEHSRIRESFALRVLTELPAGYSTPMRPPALSALIPCQDRVARACPPCPTDPWVILADIVVGRDCRVLDVDCFAHRRYVVSFAEFYFGCAAAPPTIQPGSHTFHPGLTNVLRMATLAGGGDVVDLRMASTGEAPRATVRMRRPDGSAVEIPAYFAVTPGMTMADLVDREGDREFVDPATRDTFTLRELYAHSEVSPRTVLDSTAGALAPLEDRTFDPAGIRAGRATVAELLDEKAVERIEKDFAGAPARAKTLPAASLAGLGANATLKRRLGTRTIEEVAARPKDDFVASVARGLGAAARKSAEAAAAEAWEAASRVARIGT